MQTTQAVAIAQRQTRARFGIDKVFLILVLIYLTVPLISTLVFGFTGSHGIDFSTLGQIFSDKDFAQTLSLSLELALASTLLSVALITPTIYWVQLRLPGVRPLLDILSLIPFAAPAIVMAFGLVEVYSGSNMLINVLSLGLVPLLSNPPFNIVIAPPFVYRSIDASLRSINTRVLTEASYSLGCGWWRTFLTVILPNIWPGIISAALLTFSTVMGEFTLSSLFSIYTFPIYLNQTGQEDPHKAASLSILSFILTLICVLAIFLLVRRRPGQQGEIELTAAK